jgi:eukaryotic-like serine/threonine-protein kinase
MGRAGGRLSEIRSLVAIKMILHSAYADPASLARFRLEAQTLALLHHPHVVQVYAVGEHDQHLFFVLEYVEGGDLTRMLSGAPQPPRQVAQFVNLLAQAMHVVHQQGIVHRDLKPSNVLLTAEGIPKICDFGLAKRLVLALSQAHSLNVLGTPAYMAPEQTSGRSNAVGPAADVHALGAILYEMLTARPPFTPRSWLDAVQQIQNSPPIPPSRLQQNVPRELETICLKCLEKEPGQRYASAGALAEDLQAFLAGGAIQARMAGPWAQALKWSRRQPTAAAGGTVPYPWLV